MKIRKIMESIDGSIKFVFEVPNKGVAEAIYFLFEGNYRGTIISDYAICLSSQIGCLMGCSFCETAKMAIRADLTEYEINREVELTQNYVRSRGLPRANYYALMGMGEPLLNIESVSAFYRTNSPLVKGISLSTVGIVDKIVKLANDEQLDFTLYISLHTPFDEQRTLLMPVNKKWPISEVLRAGEYYCDKKGRKTVLTYMVMPGVNDSPEHARKLASIVDRQKFLLQITCFNPPEIEHVNEVQEQFQRSIMPLLEYLAKSSIEYDLQISSGVDVQGGCGQLAAAESIHSIDSG